MKKTIGIIVQYNDIWNFISILFLRLFIYLCKQKHQRRGNHVHKLKIAMQVRKKEPVAHEMDNKGRRTNKTNI